jgi:hypothetical protein
VRYRYVCCTASSPHIHVDTQAPVLFSWGVGVGEFSLRVNHKHNIAPGCLFTKPRSPVVAAHSTALVSGAHVDAAMRNAALFWFFCIYICTYYAYRVLCVYIYIHTYNTRTCIVPYTQVAYKLHVSISSTHHIAQTTPGGRF